MFQDRCIKKGCYEPTMRQVGRLCNTLPCVLHLLTWLVFNSGQASNLTNTAHIPPALAEHHQLSTGWKPPTHQLKSHTRDCVKGTQPYGIWKVTCVRVNAHLAIGYMALHSASGWKQLYTVTYKSSSSLILWVQVTRHLFSSLNRLVAISTTKLWSWSCCYESDTGVSTQAVG